LVNSTTMALECRGDTVAPKRTMTPTIALRTADVGLEIDDGIRGI